MIQPIYNFGFLKNFKSIYTGSKEKTMPEVEALANLMNLTGIYRLFQKEDVFELIKRAQLIFPEKDLITDFFNEDLLIDFPIDGKMYNLDLNILQEFIGFELLDDNQNFLPFEEWPSQISQYRSYAGFLAKMSDTVDLDALQTNIIGKKYYGEDEGSYPDIIFSNEDLKKAENFANAIVSRIQIESFNRLEERFPNKFKELQMRNRSFQEPIFDFHKFPQKKQEALWKSFFPEMEHFDDKPTREYHIKLIHLAWLWANGFVIDKDPLNILIDPRIKNFDPNDYEIDGSGFNLWETKEDECLEDLFPLLQELELIKIAERPWEGLDLYSKP